MIESYKVKGYPITIKVTDWAGAPVSKERLRTNIGDKVATRDGCVFVGGWTFMEMDKKVLPAWLKPRNHRGGAKLKSSGQVAARAPLHHKEKGCFYRGAIRFWEKTNHEKGNYYGGKKISKTSRSFALSL